MIYRPILSLALLLLICDQSLRFAAALKCWECLDNKCGASPHWHSALATERECPPNFVCQKTIFHFLYNKYTDDSTVYKVRRSVVRGCALKCVHINELKNCTIFSNKVRFLNEEMDGCVERYCCASSLCNAGVRSANFGANQLLLVLLLGSSALATAADPV